ncbi:type IV pilus modification protein PilV [Halomonas sp.]|uniref:type IV pilus modification protein PilV n=1 Tax=Halomonas sp. TaxID=1486246 RepID=UPI00384DD9B4
MSRSKGFTLIEAMVALLVLSLGLLGVAAMQFKALQGAHAGYQRSIASLAAQDAQERLWAQMAEEGGRTCPAWSDAKDFGGDDWHGIWSVYLPSLDQDVVDPSGPPASNCEFDISVNWVEGRFEDEDAPELIYRVRLPGSAP